MPTNKQAPDQADKNEATKKYDGFIQIRLEKRAGIQKEEQEEKKELFVNWKLSDVDPKSLPYNDISTLQEEFLKKAGAKRLSSWNMLLRSDHVDPTQIIKERGGFHPHPVVSENFGSLWEKDDPDQTAKKVLNPITHRINSTNTGFVSCTDSMEMIKTYNSKTGSGNYVYMLKAAGAISPGKLNYSEREYSVPGGVDDADIAAFRQLSKDSAVNGFNGSVLYIRENFLKSNPELVKNMLEAYLEKDEVVVNQPELIEKLSLKAEVINTIAARYGVKPTTVKFTDKNIIISFEEKEHTTLLAQYEGDTAKLPLLFQNKKTNDYEKTFSITVTLENYEKIKQEIQTAAAQPFTEKNAVSQENKKEVRDKKIATEKPVETAPPLSPVPVEQKNKDLTPEQEKLHSTIVEHKKYIKNMASWKEKQSLVGQINETSGKLEAKLTYDTQLDNFLSLLSKKKLARLPVDNAAIREYLFKINEIGIKSTHTGELMEILNSYDQELISTFKNFKQAEKMLEAKKSAKGHTLTASEAADYQEIQKTLKEIMTLHERINTLAKKYSTHKNIIDPNKAAAVTRKLQKTSLNKGKRFPEKSSKKGMILYFIIMTEKSISEKKPTREYLDNLYSNQELNAYLNGRMPKRTQLKKQIQALEKELVKEKVQQLRFASQEAIATSDRRYFIVDPNTHQPLMNLTDDGPAPYKIYNDKLCYKIQDEIVSCEDPLKCAKLIEHWIYVMEEAHKNKDQFTAGIIKDALIATPVNRLFLGEHVGTLISKKAKNTFIELRDLFNKNEDRAKEYTEEMEKLTEDSDHGFVPHPSIVSACLMQMAAITDKGGIPSESLQRPISLFLAAHDHMQDHAAINSQLAIEIEKYSISDKARLENGLRKKSSSLQKEGAALSILPEPVKQEEKKPSKEEIIKYKIKESVKEFYTVQKKLESDMTLLIERLSQITIHEKLSNKNYINSLQQHFSSDFTPCLLSNFNEKLSNGDRMEDHISNMTKIVELFESPAFTATLGAHEKAILGNGWISKFINEKKIDENQIGYQSALFSEVVKPVQTIPRYALKINDLIDQVNNLTKLYENEPSLPRPENFSELTRLKERLTAQLDKLDAERIYFARIMDSGTIYREIAYDLITCITRKNKQAIDSAANSLREIPLIKFDDAITLMHKLQAENHVKTQNYIKKMYQCEAERISKELSKNEKSIKNGDPELMEISQNIAIDLLKKAHNKNVATQQAIRNAATKLCTIPPPNPLEILGILKQINLSNMEHAKGRKLERRAHRYKVCDYLEKYNDTLFNQIKDDLSGKTQAQIAEFLSEKNLENTNPENFTARRIIEYLEALKNQWETEGSVYKLAKDNKEHNEKRIQLITATITNIKQGNEKLASINGQISQCKTQLELLSQDFVSLLNTQQAIKNMDILMSQIIAQQIPSSQSPLSIEKSTLVQEKKSGPPASVEHDLPLPPLPSAEKSAFSPADEEEKKESDLHDKPGSPPPPPSEDTILSPLEKAQQATALIAREFYDAQRIFHAAMPRKIALEKEIKTLSAESSTIPLDKKMQDALAEKFAEDMIVRMNYNNFILDYKELHKNPFSDGLMVQVHKKDDPKDITVSNPDTYSIESLTAQLEKMHKQISSQGFADTCQALVHSSTARAWAMLFVKENVTHGAYPINDDLIKPTQYLMRYMTLLDTMKEKTGKLIKIAKENGKDSSKLEEALENLSKDQEKIKKLYIDPLQENVNLLTIAKILAYELIKDSGKETDSAKRILMIQTAEKLRTLAAGAKYSDLFNILRTLKKTTGVSIKRYHAIVLKQSQEYKEEVLRNIKAYIPEIKQQENQDDKDKKSDKVMESFINYMQALETEWEVESHVHKYTAKKLKEINDKIQIAKFHRDILEKTRKEKPLSLEHVVSTIESFKNELIQIDPNDTIGAQLREKAGEYAVILNSNLAGQKLNVAQLVKYLKEDKTKIANQLFALKTPGDRRLGQLVAAQSDHLNESDIEKLSTYISLRNDKNSKLPPKGKGKLYKEIQKIRDRLSQSSNELAIQQITEMKKAIDDADDNPQLLEKLGQALDTFEKNLKLIIVDDLPPIESQSTLKKIKEMVAEAKDALPPPPPPSLNEDPLLPSPPDEWIALHPLDEVMPPPPEYPPPLDGKDATILARIELRQAILEKREVVATIQTKGLSNVADEKLKSAYDLILPSVIKKIDQDFIKFVEKQVQYLEELEKKYPYDDTCDLILMSSPPNKKTLLDLKIQSHEAYIRSGDSLFYVNVVDEKCIEITPFPDNFDTKMKPTNTAITLTKEQLAEIARMTNHTRSKFKEKLIEKRQAIADEFEKRKKYSDPDNIAIVKKLLVPPPPPIESKEIQPENRDSQIKEKRAALAMLELRQCVIEQKMVNRNLLVEDADLDKDKLLSEQTKTSYKTLTREYDDYRRENFDLAQYSKEIGNYKIGKKENIKEPIGAEAQEKLALEIFGKEGYRILHSTGAPSEAKKIAASTSVRMLYLQYLQGAFDAHREKGDHSKLITMEQLLGKRGKELYKAAIAEEMADPAFINAVFLKSVENFKGPKWQQKLVLWIAGPSSSGKSYVTNGMIDRIAKWIMPKESDGEKVDNYVVTIDGGMQRQVSQIRAITVDTSIELGYRGVKDVDNGLDGKLKGKIEHAASVKDDLSIVIPDTFTKYMKKLKKLQTMASTFSNLFRKNVEKRCELISMQSTFSTKNIASLPIKSRTAYVRSQDTLFYVDKVKNECTPVKLSLEDLKKFDDAMKPGSAAKKLTKRQLQKITEITQHTRGNEILHIYSQVKCGQSDEEERTFELSVGRMGESRAFLKIGKTHYSIIMDGVTIIESKKYDKGKGGINFSLGKKFAKQGKQVYRVIQRVFDKNSYDFDVTHDLMFITFDKEKGQWRECTKDDQDNVRMITRRAFKAYQATNPASLVSKDPYEKLDAWLKDKNGGDKPTLRDPIIEFYLNGSLKDYETENLLTELDKLQKEAADFLQGKELEPGQFTVDEELISIQQYHAKVSAFILIAKESQAKKDKINVWKDYQEDIDSVKKAYKSLIDKRFEKRMQEIETWLTIAENKESLPPLKEPVDLVTLGIYMAYLLSKYTVTSLDKEQKKQLQSIITELQNVSRSEDQDLYIKSCLDKLRGLSIPDTEIKKFNKIHLAYAAAKKRDANDFILDRKKMGDPENTKEKVIESLSSYLKTLEYEWKLESIVAGDYKKEQEEYNNNRLKLLETAISDLNKSRTLGDIQTAWKKLQNDLSTLTSSYQSLSDSTKKATHSLENILTQYVNQAKAQIDTRTSFEEMIKIMNSEVQKDEPVGKYIADNVLKYLDVLKQEWETTNSLKSITKEEKDHGKRRLEALKTATIDLKPDSAITLQKTQEILGKLKDNIESISIHGNSELSRQTKQAVNQLEKLQAGCVTYRYKAWLKGPLVQPANEPEVTNLLELGRYIAHLIDIDATIENSLKESITKKLRGEINYISDDNEKTQKFIYDALPTELKNNDKFNKLFIEHAQAIRRDLQTKITKESPEVIINTNGIDIDKPDTYNEYVARRIIEYLKSIEAEWVARELTTGASKGNYAEHRRILNKSIVALGKDPSPVLEDIKKELKNLGTQLQGILSQPTGLARAYIFASRSRTGKKSAELISHTKEDIDAIAKMNDTYITPFIDALNKDKEQKEEIAKTEPRRIFLTGKDSKNTLVKNKSGVEIQGTATILKLFGDEVKQQRSKTEYKEGDTPPSSIDLTGWDAQKSAKITESAPTKAPSLAATTTECRGLPSGMCIEYTLLEDNTTTIRESHQNNHVNISAPIEPPDYATMSDEKKLAIDITIAEAMIRLWVARCGTPVYISDTPNKSRMSALIIVCEAHDLHYELPYSSRFNYSFLNNPKVELQNNIQALEKDIGNGNRTQIKVLNDSAAMRDLETKFNALKTHYEELKSDKTLPEEEKKRYTKEISTIDGLIDNAKKGKYSAKAANDAVMELKKSLAEIERHPISRSSLRGGL